MTEPEAFDDFVLSIARETWDLFRREPVLFVLGSLVVTLVSVLSLGLVAGPVSAGYVEMVRRGRRGEPLAMGLIFSRFDTFVPTAIAFFIIGIAIVIGAFLLVLPALVVALFTAFTLHVITYENVGGIAAMQRSVAIVRANFIQVLALLLLIAVAHAVGGIIIFGVLLTAPLSLIALTIGYERLAGAAAPERLVI
ncbi:MAG: hypothetical protein RLZZ450_871 [Pseudomonadota bacterium]|jgi:uncharacterized membrane protein